MESQGSHKLNIMPLETHTTAPIFNDLREIGVTIAMPWGINNTDLEKALQYGTHSSALKEKIFVWKDLT